VILLFFKAVSRSIDIFGLGDILGDTGQKIGLKVES
jgi:hypothetical protein